MGFMLPLQGLRWPFGGHGPVLIAVLQSLAVGHFHHHAEPAPIACTA